MKSYQTKIRKDNAAQRRADIITNWFWPVFAVAVLGFIVGAFVFHGEALGVM